MTIQFTLPMSAQPVQTGGKRVMIRGGKPLFFKDKRTTSYENALTVLAANHAPEQPMEGPIHIGIVFVMARPKYLMVKKANEGLIEAAKRPDLDNLMKGVLDPLTRLGFWRDDSQITSAAVRKLYAEKDGSARIEIKIVTL